MTAHQDETLTAHRQDLGEEKDMPGNSIEVGLTATAKGGGKISVDGDGDAELPVNSGATRFNFTLTDNTGLNVRFVSLDAADNSTACPPPPGENSKQITGVVIHDQDASFTDNNSNNAADGPMSISYAWNFTCDTGATCKYDPIITNGGKTGP